jgi:hypothetical protein
MTKKKYPTYSKKEIENILKENVFAKHILELEDLRFGLNMVLWGKKTLLRMFGEYRSSSRDSHEHASYKLFRTIMLNEAIENIPLYLNGVPNYFYESRRQPHRIVDDAVIECGKILARYRLKKGA